jgi:hypothetical protein
MSERNASVLTSLQAIAKKAKERPEYRFRDLFRLLNEHMLKDSWRYIHKDAAFGVDGVSAAEYEQNLEANIHQLVEELKRKRYRAKRHYLARLARKSRCFSRCPYALECALRFFVFCFNSRQLHKHRFPNYHTHVMDFVSPLF